MSTIANPDERLQRYLRYLERDPGNLNLLADAIDLSLAEEKLEQARELTQRGLKASSNAPAFRYRLSCVARAERDWEQAVALSEGLLGEGEASPAIHYNLGVALAMLGRFAEAKPHLSKAAAATEPFPNLPYVLVYTLHHLGELEEASRVAEAHLQTKAGDAAMAGALSTLYIDRENFGGAREWAARALKSDPDDINGLVTSGALALTEEDTDRADASFKRALEIQPANGRAWLGRAMTRMLKLDIKGARADFEQAAKRMPGHIGSWHGLAWCQILDNDVNGADESFKKALELNRNFAETHGGLAVIAALQGRWPAAENLATKALKLDRMSFSARLAQSLLLQKAGKPEVAQELIRKVLTAAKTPTGGSLMDMAVRVRNKNAAGEQR